MRKKIVDRVKLYELIQSGHTDKECADVFSCAKMTISKIRLEEFGLRRKRGGVRTSWKRRMKLIKMIFERGIVEVKDVCAELDVNPNILNWDYRKLVEMGIPIFKRRCKTRDRRTGYKTYYYFNPKEHYQPDRFLKYSVKDLHTIKYM